MISSISKSSNIYTRNLFTHSIRRKNRLLHKRLFSNSIRIDDENIPQFLAGQNIFENENLLKQLMIQATSTKRDTGDFVPSKITSYLVNEFERLNDDDKLKFFTILANELGVENSELSKLTNDLSKLLQEKRDEQACILVEKKLRSALTPSYEKLFIQINAQKGGMKKLIDMRESLLRILRKNADRSNEVYPKLKYLEGNLKNLLQQWFSIGFLNLERITWEHPGIILEKIFHYSTSVHPMKDWAELKRRLQNNKRCYAYFHPSIPSEPVIFIEVELTNEISNSIEPITQQISSNIENPTTAIFYAITSTQGGLSGIDLGNMLIKRVVKELKIELPSLNTFCTLSPIPSFKKWLETNINLAENEKTKELHKFEFLTPKEIEFLRSRFPNENEPAKLFKAVLSSDWIKDEQLCNFLEGPLMRICAKYIYSEKKNNLTLDPVANFHLRNGAQFFRINWLADKSEHRLKQSYGIMANYLYIIEEVNENNENYLMKGEVKASKLILDLINCK